MSPPPVHDWPKKTPVPLGLITQKVHEVLSPFGPQEPPFQFIGMLEKSNFTWSPISNVDFLEKYLALLKYGWSYLGRNEPLTSWTLFSSLFDWFAVWPVQKWGKKCSTGQRFIFTKVTSYKIHTLDRLNNFKIFIYFRLRWNKIQNHS